MSKDNKKQYLLFSWHKYEYYQKIIYADNATEACTIIHSELKGKPLDEIDSLECYEIVSKVQVPLNEWWRVDKKQHEEALEKLHKRERKETYEKLQKEFGEKNEQR